MDRRSLSTGFTLIEVLIVVALIAILAATLIPQFSSSAQDAKESSLRYDLMNAFPPESNHRHRNGDDHDRLSPDCGSRQWRLAVRPQHGEYRGGQRKIPDLVTWPGLFADPH
jgi:prepilin-type N-terminal cleavage/methylation domain-containing protein